ncbi:hypothetical protein CLV24_1306 [Pontibacter ummariensis]|uniref:Uncharacterized protein n=1 Tax=Pontibacter ummariensis TaxID=1610492 RepID=A0A239KNT2_9BACT|nr:hypothetical protein CLV24_1306 [Pontibacter ummariensis]SNT19273.1 hypothetical protein SAMN06296052_1306 [Pontibacter ummariensis]
MYKSLATQRAMHILIVGTFSIFKLVCLSGFLRLGGIISKTSAGSLSASSSPLPT